MQKSNNLAARKTFAGFSVAKELIVMTLAVALLSGACSQKDSSAKDDSSADGAMSEMASTAEDLAPLTPDATLGWEVASEAGMKWDVPSAWTVGPEMPMRAGTYFASAAEGDSEPAECRVNFFGAGQGGPVDDNIKRWSGQMELEGQEGQRPTPLVSRVEVAGIPVAVIEINGVYLSKSRPMATEFTRKSGFTMFAAIATAPEGTIFYKMTGPCKTMDENRENFRRMIGSIASSN